MIAYVDSSVVLRKVLGQPGQLAAWVDIDDAITSVLTEVECLRTLDRARHHGMTDAQLAQARTAVFALLKQATLITITPGVLSRASQALPTPLRTLDAVHLASALMWQEAEAIDLGLATHDGALAQAGRACGLTVIGV